MSEEQQQAGDEHPASSGLAMEPTGVPNLDRVLGGGFPRGSLVIISGPPGSGKTTLANQIAFAAAHRGKRAVVVSAISEPTSKLISHLRAFRFYEDRLVGDTIQFISLDQFLPNGLNATGGELIGIARQTRAEVVVLDGFRGVRGADVDPQAARQFLYDVGTTLSALGVTTLITSEADPRDPAFFPESTTADVIIGLHYTVAGVQQRRAIEAIKMRGAEPLPGLHGVWLSGLGLTVYPRLEARIATRAEVVEPDRVTVEDAHRQSVLTVERTPFGLPELDDLLGGGLPRGTSTLVIGSLGTGKTTLALHFAIAGVRAGEPTVMLSFRESLTQLLQKAGEYDLGQDFYAALAPGGLLTLQRWAPIELKPDIVADRLLATLDETGARRLVLDSVAELEAAVARSGDNGRTADYLAALIEALRVRSVTALFIKEHRTTVASELDLAASAISVLAENVLLLQQLEYRAELHRVLSIIKLRFSAHDSLLHEFVIRAPQGIHLLGLFTRGELLAGEQASTAQHPPDSGEHSRTP